MDNRELRAILEKNVPVKITCENIGGEKEHVSGKIRLLDAVKLIGQIYPVEKTIEWFTAAMQTKITEQLQTDASGEEEQGRQEKGKETDVLRIFDYLFCLDIIKKENRNNMTCWSLTEKGDTIYKELIIQELRTFQ